MRNTIHDSLSYLTVDEYTSIGEPTGLWKWYRTTRRINRSYLLLPLIFKGQEPGEHQEDIIIHSDCDDMYDVNAITLKKRQARRSTSQSSKTMADYQAYGLGFRPFRNVYLNQS